MLEVNTKAPFFSLYDQDNKLHNLQDYLGKKVLLFFYPKDLTSGCTIQNINYTKELDKFNQLNVVVLGINLNDNCTHKKFIEKNELKHTLLVADQETVNNYDVYKEKKMYGRTYFGIVRTTYLIDEDGFIVYSNDKVNTSNDALKMIEVIQGKR